MLAFIKAHRVVAGILILGIGIVSYIIVKAGSISFIHDESYSYLHYVHEDFMDIVSYKRPYFNNHILNTVLMKYSEVCFGNSELALRLPNILASVTYLIFSFLMMSKHAPKLTVSFFILLGFNVYLLDFFSLARGYGLSFCFMMMSLYYLIAFFKTHRESSLILFNVGGFLSVMSNFSLLNYYIPALVTFNIIFFLENHKTDWSLKALMIRNKINLISIFISGMVLYEPLRRVSRKSMLDFGGKSGFIEDTVGSLIKGLFYDSAVNPVFYVVLMIVSVSMILVILFTILIQAKANNTKFFMANSSLVIVNLVLMGIVCLTLIQHYAFGNDFYTERFALFLYPVFILNVAFYFNYLLQKQYTVMVMATSALLALGLCLNFYFNANISYCRDWKYDMETKQVMRCLVSDHQKNSLNQKPVRLGINWLFEPSTNFYRYTWNLNWLRQTHRQGISKDDTYFYIFRSDTNSKMALQGNILYESSDVNSLLTKRIP